MTDRELALRYAPWIHYDAADTIPLRAAGYTGSERTVRNYLRASCQTLSSRPKEETTL